MVNPITLFLLLPILLTASDNHRNLIQDNDDDEDYPMIVQCNIHENMFHENNSIIFDFDIIEATSIIGIEKEGDDNDNNNIVKDEDDKLLKVEFLVHAKEEYTNVMTNFNKCTINISKTYEYHQDAIQAMSPSTNANATTFMNTATATLKSTNEKGYETISSTYNCFRSINGIHQSIQHLNKTFANRNIIQIETIGQSYLKSIHSNSNEDVEGVDGGDDLVIIKLSNFNITDSSDVNSDNKDNTIEKSNILLIFGIHAREYAPPELGMRYIEHLLSSYVTDANIKTILDSTTLHFLLYSNPDGRRIAEEYPKLYVRKNRNRSSRDCGNSNSGIDLNRNFPFMWGGLGASSFPCSETFRGPNSQSEPETQSIVNYASKIFPSTNRHKKNNLRKRRKRGEMRFKPYPITNTGIFLDIHSYGQLNIYPWSYRNKNTPNVQSYIATSTKLSYFNEHKNAGPLSPSYLYEAAGDTTDFMYGTLGVLSFTLEIGNKFYERCTFFESKYAPNNINALDYISKLAIRPYALSVGPDVITIDYDIMQDTNTATNTTTTSSSTTSHYLCIIAIISDKEYATNQKTNLTYVTGIQDVIKAYVIIDEYPHYYYDETKIDKPYTSYPMIQNTEDKDEWNIVVPLGNLNNGQHIFHIFAIDSSNDIGPLSSKFFYICNDDDSPCNSASATSTTTTPAATINNKPKTCNTIPCSLHANKDMCIMSTNGRRCAWDDSSNMCLNDVPRKRRRRWHNKRNNIDNLEHM